MTGLQKAVESGIQTFDITNGNMPDLDAAEELNLDLMDDYWSPERRGRSQEGFLPEN